MCHKLLQVYACGHLKDVSTTPCPHAIATGRQLPQDNNNSPELSRSPSIISAPTSPATPVRKDDKQDLPSQRQSQQARPSPLRVSEQAPAFRFVAPGDGTAAPPPGYVSNEPSPTFSTGSGNAPSPATLFFQADPEMDISNVDPNFCAYHFPRYLPQSKVPCLACYGTPQWEGYRTAWMWKYKEQHPSVKEDDLDVLSGVKGAMSRFGG